VVGLQIGARLALRPAAGRLRWPAGPARSQGLARL